MHFRHSISAAIVAVALLGGLSAAAAPQSSGEDAVPRISLADLKKAVDAKSVLVVDVRDAVSYAAGHIPGAVSVPLADIKAKAAGWKASRKPIVTYCG